MHVKLGALEIKMVENRLLEPKNLLLWGSLAYVFKWHDKVAAYSFLNKKSDVIFHRGIKIGIEYRRNSLVSVPTTEILVS